MPKNIVLINLETYDYYKYGNYDHPGLPFLNGLSSQGTICHNCYTTSAICVPSRHAMMTGCLPSKSCGLRNVRFVKHDLDGKHTIGNVLQSKGYYTGYVGKSHLNSSYVFDDVECSINDTDYQKCMEIYMKRHNQEVEYIKRNGFDYVDRIFPNNPSKHVVRELRIHNDFWVFNGAYEFINNNSNKDFFIYINPTMFHGPYTPTSAYAANPRFSPTGILDKASHNNSYKSDEDYIDHCIKQLFDTLERNGVLNDTIIFITGDHSSVGKFTINEPGAHIPLTVWDGSKKHKIINHYISFIDFLPTFCEIADISHQEIASYNFDGISQYDVIFNGGDRVRDHIYLEIELRRGIIKDGFKYVKLIDGIKPSDKRGHAWPIKYKDNHFDNEQLYKLEDEDTNLIDDESYTDILNEMREILSSYL